jgi:putative ABC transport system substrate-binding protein
MNTRRHFITLLGGAAATWPLAARGQQPDQVRRIGVLMAQAADDPEGRARVAAFLQTLHELEWIEGRNVRIDYRWGGGDIDRIRRDAAELVALAPEVILAGGGQVMGPLREATRTVPIVFTQTADPVGAGFVATLSRPGGNATGFTNFEYGVSGKWLEVLREIVPGLTRAAVLRDPTNPAGTGQWGAIQAVASPLGVETSPIDVREPGEIERGVTAFAAGSNGGMIVSSSGFAILHRKLIIALAARHRLPTVYPFRFYAIDGGLISYGPDPIDPHRRAARYVDRILKGREAGRPAGAGSDQVRTRDQFEDSEGARPHSAADAARPRRRGHRMTTRREFITLLGGAAAAWPLAASTQQPSVPVIGFLYPGSFDAETYRLRAFREGLKDTGYIEGESVAIEYRFADSQLDRLPALAVDLVKRRVAVNRRSPRRPGG